MIMTREEFGRKVIETASAYASYRWIPTEKMAELLEDGYRMFRKRELQ